MDAPAAEPHNIEAEQALLGALLVNNDALARCEGLTAADFYDPLHGRIFDVAARRIEASGVASPATLRPVFETDPGMAQLGGPAYLARLAGAAISIAATKDYARSIKDAARRRAIILACREAESLAVDMEQPADAALAAVENAMLAIGDDGDEGAAASIYVAMGEAVIAMMQARADGAPALGVTSGLDSLDAITGGWRPGQLIILAGRPGMGKSTAALWFARAAAMAGHGVHLASLEMSGDEIAIRQAALEIWARKRRWVHYNRIVSDDITDDEAADVVEAVESVKGMPLRLGAERARSIGAIAADARRSAKAFEAQGKSLGLVVIDQISHVTPPRQRQSKVHEVGDISRAAKEIAKTLGVPVILLSQLNRAVENRDGRRPQLSDLRDSGDVEQDADKVIFCFREEYYLANDPPPKDPEKLEAHLDRIEAARDRLEFIVAKNRMGRTGSTTVFCSIGVNAFAEVK